MARGKGEVAAMRRLRRPDRKPHRLIGALVALPIGLGLLVASPASPASAALPDGRVYEQVSEVNKAGQDAGPVITVGTANPPSTLFAMTTAGGDGFIYGSYGSFAGAMTGFPSSYRASRTPQGWVSSTISPGLVEPGNVPNTMNASADLATTAITINSSDVGIDGQGSGLYVREPDGRIVKASGDSAASVTYRGGSLDGRHHFFESTEQLIPGVPAPPGTFAPRLYEWADGELRLVDRLPGTDLPSTYGANGGGGGTSVGIGWGDARHAVSENGTRIAFISPGKGQSTSGNPSRLYLRIDGERTVEVSRSRCERVAPDPACNAPAVINYQDAAVDGSKVLFTTTQQLLDEDVDSLSDVYSYDVESDSLMRLSAGVGGATSVVGSSFDGKTVYFGAVSNKRIYISEDGAAPRLAVLTTGPTIPGLAACPSEPKVSRDGRVLVFRVNYPIEDADGNPLPIGLYRYELDGTGTLTRIASGPSTSNYILGSQSCFGYSGVSDDGEYIAFSTQASLLPEDRNDSHDVYQWHDGELSLISGGTGDHSRFLTMTPDGSDIFFTTWDRLTPTDTDAAQDIYTARIGGGITPVPAPIRCADDDCQGPASSPPGGPALGSAGLGGSGNARPAVQPRKASLRVAKRKRITGATARLRLRVPAAGRISVGGSGVRATRRVARKAGTYQVKVSLTPKAKKQLRKRKSLRVGLRLTYRSQDGHTARKRISVRFQQRAGKRAGAGKGGR